MTEPTRQALAEAVIADLKRGIWSIPLKAGGKRPVLKGWPSLRIGEGEVASFYEAGMNRGRLIGVPGEDGCALVVIDLDVAEALALAEFLLPATGELGGRHATPGSHWYYLCPAAPRTRRFNDLDGQRILDLLSGGSQVVVPPSIHPTGDRYAWLKYGEPSDVSREELTRACEDLAIACLLVRMSTAPLEALEELGSILDDSRSSRLRGAIARAGVRPPTQGVKPDALVERVADWLGCL